LIARELNISRKILGQQVQQLRVPLLVDKRRVDERGVFVRALVVGDG
jgi:DNA-binding HxlR family transcriptional regulator